MSATSSSPRASAEAPLPGESRKQFEIRCREAQILAVARDQILEGGYLGLNMDRIAAQIDYSKGTIYQHFRNKEEILLALVNDALETRKRMFRVASAFEGPNRVRLATVSAAAEAFVEHFPYHFKVEQIVRAASIWEKTSPERRQLMQTCEKSCMETVVELVNGGIAAGDLTLPENVRPEEIVFGLWSIYLGAQIITHSSDTLHEIGIECPIRSLRTNQQRMLDGYGWRPLSTEFDYKAHMCRVKAELFRHDQFAS